MYSVYGLLIGAKVEHYVGLGMLVMVVMLLRQDAGDVLWGRLYISEERVEKRNLWGTRVLQASEIKGYRENDGRVSFYPKDEKKKKIVFRNLYGQAELYVEVIAGWYVNLDEQDKQDAITYLENDLAFGATHAARKKKAQRLKWFAYGLIAIAVLGLVWQIFTANVEGYARFKVYELTFNVFYPLCMLTIVLSSKGTIVLFAIGKKLKYPDLSFAYALPILCLWVQRHYFYELLDVYYLYAVVGALALLVTFSLWSQKMLVSNTSSEVSVTYALFALSFGFYCFLALSQVNYVFDWQTPEQYTVTILNKRETNSGNRYFFEVTPAGPIQTPQEVEVYYELFDAKAKGDTVYLFAGNGWLDMPWVSVDEN